MRESGAPSVLLVEDDVSGRAMLGLTLRQAGFQVQTASSGDEALLLLELRPFDWMVTDGRMRPMDGFELARRAKRLRPELRILMVSAVYTEKDVQDYPIEGFFAKPISTDSLLARLSDGALHLDRTA